MPKRECYESRKKLRDGAWLNPKRYTMGLQHPLSE